MALLEYLVPRWNLSPFGAGRPFWGCLGCGPTKRHVIPKVWRGVTFWAGGSTQALAKKKLLKQTVAWLGRLLVIRWMGGTWVPAPSICDRRLPVHLWVPQGWHIRQLDKQRKSQSDSYLLLGWLVPPDVWWSWHVACGVTQPGSRPWSQLPWWLWSRQFQLPRQFGHRWPWLPWPLRSRGPQHPWQHRCRQL